MKYAFIALHRLQFSVRTMCRLLRVHPSGFYAWLKNPLSRRANEDKRQTDLLLKAWEESGKVYGYRKLHDNLIDQGEMGCPNRVAHLTRLFGIKAQIGYKRRPGIYGGRPAVAIDNTLDRPFDLAAPDKALVTSPILRSSSISFPAALSAGRWRADKPSMSFYRLCVWPCGDASRRRRC